MTDPARFEDPAYPIYSVKMRWSQDTTGGDTFDPDSNRAKGLPPGRVWNSAVIDRMYREDPGTEAIEAWARDEWWPLYAKKFADRNPGEPKITVTRTGEETWCLSWFEHWTFDVGQSDEEALASFQRYVDRYRDTQDYWPGDPPEGYRCLMGAEDRWRWCGTYDGSPSEKTDPPCRCEHCKAQGVIRIGH